MIRRFPRDSHVDVGRLDAKTDHSTAHSWHKSLSVEKDLKLIQRLTLRTSGFGKVLASGHWRK